MAATERRYPKEEFARRGDEIYAAKVRPHLSTADDGKFVAIDIDSGEYEVDTDEMAACNRLHSRIANAQVWTVKVGSPYVHRFGYRKYPSAK